MDKERESYDLRLEVLDRNGNQAERGRTTLFGSAGEPIHLPAWGTPQNLRLLKGTYTAVSVIYTGTEEQGMSATMLVEPNLELDRNRTLTLDARVAKAVKVTAPQPDAASIMAKAQIVVDSATGRHGFALSGTNFDDTYIGQPDPHSRSERVTTYIANTLVPKDSKSGPYVDNFLWQAKGHAPTGFVRDVRAGDLATVVAKTATQGVPTASVTSFGSFDGVVPWLYAETTVTMPGERVEYYSTEGGVKWYSQVFEGAPSGTMVATSPLTRYEPGGRYTQMRNYGVFGPGFDHTVPYQVRRGDQMVIATWLHCPGGGWTGDAYDATARMVVERNGTVIADAANAFVELQVPPEDAAYKVSVVANRGAPNTLSTQVAVTWTFRSAHVAGEAGLPVSAVRFEPRLNETNTAPAGATVGIPFWVQRVANSAAGTVRSLSVDVSYDDGATWQKATVLRGGQFGVAIVKHPAGAGFVSLRASAADSAGNTLEQTVIRAYRIA